MWWTAEESAGLDDTWPIDASRVMPSCEVKQEGAACHYNPNGHGGEIHEGPNIFVNSARG